MFQFDIFITNSLEQSKLKRLIFVKFDLKTKMTKTKEARRKYRKKRLTHKHKTETFDVNHKCQYNLESKWLTGV